MSTPFDIFKQALLDALGDTLARRGYVLNDDAIQIRSGLYRFSRPAGADALSLVDVQLLFYEGGGPSRFEVKVWRSDRTDEKTRLGLWLHEQGLETVADGLGWWEFVSRPELEESLRDAASGLGQMLNAE